MSKTPHPGSLKQTFRLSITCPLVRLLAEQLADGEGARA